MSALEQELIDRIRKLDENQQRQVLAYIHNIEEEPGLTLGEWLDKMETWRQKLEAKYGTHHFPSATEIIKETHEERLNDILGGV